MEVQHPEIPPSTSTTPIAAEPPANKPVKWLLPALIGLSFIFPLVGERMLAACSLIFYPAPHGLMIAPPEYVAAELKAMTINTAIGYGLCGAVFFFLMGGLVGAASSAGRALRGALIGGVVGFVLAAVAGAVGYRIEVALRQEDMDAMYRTAMVLIAVFLAFAVTAGLIAQWSRMRGSRMRRSGTRGSGTQGSGTQGSGTRGETTAGGAQATLRTLGTAILVAVLGIVAYILIATIAIPTGWTEGMHPTELSVRYLFFFCLALAATACAGLLLKPRTA